MAKRKKGKVRLAVGDEVKWIHDEEVVPWKVTEIKKSDSEGTVAVIFCGDSRLTVPITELRLSGEVA
jgi:hypothetical protein